MSTRCASGGSGNQGAGATHEVTKNLNQPKIRSGYVQMLFCEILIPFFFSQRVGPCSSLLVEGKIWRCSNFPNNCANKNSNSNCPGNTSILSPGVHWVQARGGHRVGDGHRQLLLPHHPLHRPLLLPQGQLVFEEPKSVIQHVSLLCESKRTIKTIVKKNIVGCEF